MKKRLSALCAEMPQRLGLLVAFLLLVAARGHAVEHPALDAALIFGFSLPYLLAAVVTRRGHFLYATMLLGAVSYFLTCHALGAPAVFFPALSVPLVLALLLVGRHLEVKLGDDLDDFPRTVYRAMHITVAVFTGWTLKQAPATLASTGPAAYVSSFTCVAFAAIYLAHFAGGAHVLYAYVVSAFLLTGAVLGGAAVWPVTFWWMPAAVAAAIVLLLGARFHRLRDHRVGRHFYVGGVAALLASLALALAHWPFFLLALSLGSLFLWMTYRKLEGMTREVRRAKMAERVLGKVFFLGSLVLMIPVGVMVFALPLNAMVGAAAVVCGGVMAWMTARRGRDLFWGRNLYALGAGLFLSAGLFGLAALLPEASAGVVAVALPALFLAGMAGLDKRVEAMGRSWKGLGEAAVFPALFAWYVPLLAFGPATGLMASLAVLLVIGFCAAFRRGRGFLLGLGPAVAGALTCAALLYAAGPMLWLVPLGGAILAALCYGLVASRGMDVVRNAGSLAWLILSIAAAIVAGFAGAPELLYCATAIGTVAILLSGRRREGWNVYELLIAATAVVTGALAIALGPISSVGPAAAGTCLVALGAACALSWASSGRDHFAQMAGGIAALGTILVIFGFTDAITARIALGAAVPAALFVLAGLARKRRPDLARSLESVGHAAGTALALAALILASRQTPQGLALAMVPYGLLYTLMPGLKKKEAFRFGAGCWASLAILFAAASHLGGAYYQQAPLMAWLAVIWLGLGYLGRAKWSSALYALSALLAVAAGAANVYSVAGADTWWVYLMTGSVFTALFVLRREDIFAYLLTLSLTLLTYDWVKASTSGFTQDVLFYLVIGVLVMGTFFLLPYLKRLLERGPALPMISIFTWRGAALAAVPVSCGAMLLLSVYSVKLTEHPKFCVSCHYMGEYYESWQHSSHQDVACVKCHYEPGVQAEVKGKMEGMVQFVKYVSHAYSTKPHAQISNSACMREGCHAGMDHSKQAELFKGRIKFRHEEHLSGSARGKDLNCVSCHGQVVEGTHISVTETTCVTCHFYGRDDDHPVAAGKCTTCHDLPQEPVSFGGQSFSHTGFLHDKDQVACTECHTGVTEGTGAVSRTRCQSCHLNDIPEVKDQKQFHLIHVSEGHFDCLQCHDEIKHGQASMTKQMMPSTDCGRCHGQKRHSLQELVYAGHALGEEQTSPDVMYSAGVSCEGCHTDVEKTSVGSATYATHVSGPKQCSECHGMEGYGAMLNMWQTQVRGQLKTLRPALSNLKNVCAEADASKENVRQAGKLAAAAGTKIDCVVRDGSDGAHNVGYIMSLLGEAESEIEQANDLLKSEDDETEAE